MECPIVLIGSKSTSWENGISLPSPVTCFLNRRTQREHCKVGEIQDVGFQTRFLWIEFAMFVLAFEFLLDHGDDFPSGNTVIVVQPANPFLNSAVHPDLAAVMDEPVNKTIRLNKYLIFPAH